MVWEIHYRDFGSESGSQLGQSVCSCSIAAIRLAVASLSGTTEGPPEKNTVEKWNWISVPPLYSLLSRAAFLRRQAPVSQELKSILSIEVSRNNAKLYSHKQNKQIRSPCCAGTCTAVLSRRETIAHDLPAQNEFQSATWERSPRGSSARLIRWRPSPAAWENGHGCSAWREGHRECPCSFVCRALTSSRVPGHRSCAGPDGNSCSANVGSAGHGFHQEQSPASSPAPPAAGPRLASAGSQFDIPALQGGDSTPQHKGDKQDCAQGTVGLVTDDAHCSFGKSLEAWCSYFS